MTDSPEHPHNPELRAAIAIWNYLDVGPEPNFGDIPVARLDSWIAECRAAPLLTPEQNMHVAWMYKERAWSRLAENNVLGSSEVPEDILNLVLDDLSESGNRFELLKTAPDVRLRAQSVVSRVSIPIIRHVMTQPPEQQLGAKRAIYLQAQIAASKRLTQDLSLKRQHRIMPQDIPTLDNALGLRLLTNQLFQTDKVVLPAAPRHSTSGNPYSRWHVAIYDRNLGRIHKVRIAPYGPSDMVLMPPDVFDHNGFESPNGRGTLWAFHVIDIWKEYATPLSSPSEIERAAQKHLDHVDKLVEASLTEQLGRLKGDQPTEHTPHTEPLKWFAELPPFVDATHESHGGTLEAAIAELEVQKAAEEITPENLFRLGYMHIEAGTSLAARDAERTALLVGSMERAEDIFNELRKLLPAHSSRYYEAALGEVTARMYRAIVAAEEVEEAIEVYNIELATVAAQMLEDYRRLPDKTTTEAVAMTRLMQQVTVLLGVTSTRNGSFIALASTPRQRGGGDQPRGWDVTLWTLEDDNTYLPAEFYTRLEDEPDPLAVDHRVVVMPFKPLGQWTPQHDFVTLRTAIHHVDPKLVPRVGKSKIDTKTLRRAVNNVVESVMGKG